METKSYIRNLLKGKGIEINTNRNSLFDEFVNYETNKEIVKSIFENQSKIIMNWNIKNRIADIQAQQIVIPNAKELITYTAKIDFSALNLNDLIEEKFEGLEELGLCFNKETDTIEGTPTKSGDVKIKFLFKIKGEEETSTLNEKLISLVINPDPKSLWKSLPSDPNLIFAKPDNVEIFEKLGEKNIVVSSKRGRSHGKEIENTGFGSPRDDDFAFKYFEKTQWSLVVVSDGAGSAYLARAGSKITCDSVVEYFENNSNSEQEIKLEILIDEYSKNQTEDKLNEIKKLSKFNLWQASIFVHNKLKEFVEQTFSTNPELFNNPKAKTNLEYLHSTLIFTLFKKYDFGYLIQSFGVGDCPIAVMNTDKTETTLLNWLDVGEYGGGTRFITQPDIFQKQEVMITRFNLKLIEDFSYLFLMTDGIYDAKFVVEANLEKHEKWIEFLEDLGGKNEGNDKVDFIKDNSKIANQLSKWMDFWSPGNHDDRTLAVVFKQYYMQTISIKSILDNTKTYQYVDNGEPMRGGMKDVYFSPDKSYVVAFFRAKLDFNQKERVISIATIKKDSIFNVDNGQYWKNVYCWPYDVVEKDGLTGIIVPAYDKRFFFKQGYANNDILKGKEKNGKWFASAKFRTTNSKTKLDNSELGNWLNYFQVCVNIARGVKRLHSAGLAHSDLSYNNVLIDPTSGSGANIIDIDGLVVPGKYPPEVIGTADFIAPEVMATKHLNKNDPNRKLPNQKTDLHALAVLIYMYLLYRHPLRGGNYFGQIDEVEEEIFLMGSKALFVEHPTDSKNRNFKREYGDNLEKFKPWTDLSKTPYTITGPYLKELFDQAFIKGLHNPIERPTADAWEQALIKTNDLKLECSNKQCEQKWFVFNNTNNTKCPFCNTKYNNTIPVLDLFYQFKPNVWKPENQRIVVYNNATLHQWHTNRNIIRNETLTEKEKISEGYFAFHNGKWVFVNQKLTSLKDVTEDKQIPIGSMVEITNGKKFLFSKEDGGRVAIITIANN